MAVIGSFVLDETFDGFTPPGISRLNDSIRTLVWGILGSQTQTRSSILGTGKAFDTQRQFLANIEGAINSEVDLPKSIERYQLTLQYARSKLDFVIGTGLYLIPSNMEMQVGVINNYNKLIQIATDDMDVGINTNVNAAEGEPEVEPEGIATVGSPPTEGIPPTEPEGIVTKGSPVEPLTHDEKKTKTKTKTKQNKQKN